VPQRAPQQRAPRAARVAAPEARRKIVAATTRLLETRRFRDLTVDDVMAEAGLARTVFYRHFNALPDIVLGLLGELLGEVVAVADAGEADDRGVMRRQLALAVEAFRVHGRLLLAFEEAAHDSEEIERARRALFERSVDVIAELLQRGVERGHTPALPVRDVARALHTMNSYYLLDLVASEGAFDGDAALEALWCVWTRTTWPTPMRPSSE
jgi:TetR/AcrR family transcriptional regulator, ethionamide resistance regulator